MNDYWLELLKFKIRRIAASRTGLLAIAALGTFATVAVALQGSSPKPIASIPEDFPSEDSADIVDSSAAPDDSKPFILDLPAKYRERLFGPSTPSQKKQDAEDRLSRLARETENSDPLSTYWSSVGGSTTLNYNNLFPFGWLGESTKNAIARQSPRTSPQNTTAQKKSKFNFRIARGQNSPKQVAQTHSETVPRPESARELPLALNDAVTLALANNREIKNAYLERIAQRADLAVAEGTFIPKLTPRVEGRVLGDGNDRIERAATTLDLGANISIKIPTGAELSVNWGTNFHSLNSNLDRRSLGQQISLNLKQPLLRNAGVAVNTADLQKARLTEEINVLDLRKTLEGTIANVVFAYRNLLQNQGRVTIEEAALESAKALVERDRALIEAGRIARVDLIQSQAQVANVEVRLVEARNAVERARLELINLLDVDRNLKVVALAQPEIEPAEIDPESLQRFMLVNQPDYLQSQLEVERSKLSLLQAENNRRWNLDLEANVGEDLENRTDFRAGLIFSRQLDNREIERDFERSRINLLKAENSLAGLEDNLQIELADRLRDIDLSFQQVELARQARELAERNLAIEQERRAFGRSDIFQIVRLQDDLVNAQNAELNATINYLNAVTRLDRTIGNTLNTWGVSISEE